MADKEILKSLVNPYGLTSEDKAMTLETITGIEKQFLNYVRHFRGQQWLKIQVEGYKEEVIADLCDKTVEHKAFDAVLNAIKCKELEPEQAFECFLDIQNDMYDDMEDKITDHWATDILSTFTGDLMSVREEDQ